MKPTRDAGRARAPMPDQRPLGRPDRDPVAVELARHVDSEPSEELRAAWVAEGVARLEQVERDEVKTLDLDEVRAAVQHALRR